MPYILKKENGVLMEHRKALEPHLCHIARNIREVALLFHETLDGRIPIYRFVCEELALKVQPEKRYALLSAVRAVFSDANYEWCRRMKVRPTKVEFVGRSYPIKGIEELAFEINQIANEGNSPHLAWPGLFNYCITILGLKIMDDPKDKKFSALIAGTLKYLHASFYGKYMAPYEDKQSDKNGDVYPF